MSRKMQSVSAAFWGRLYIVRLKETAWRRVKGLETAEGSRFRPVRSTCLRMGSKLRCVPDCDAVDQRDRLRVFCQQRRKHG
jgi:hypothetical protein